MTLKQIEFPATIPDGVDVLERTRVRRATFNSKRAKRSIAWVTSATATMKSLAAPAMSLWRGRSVSCQTRVLRRCWMSPGG